MACKGVQNPGGTTLPLSSQNQALLLEGQEWAGDAAGVGRDTADSVAVWGRHDDVFTDLDVLDPLQPIGGLDQRAGGQQPRRQVRHEAGDKLVDGSFLDVNSLDDGPDALDGTQQIAGDEFEGIHPAVAGGEGMVGPGLCNRASQLPRKGRVRNTQAPATESGRMIPCWTRGVSISIRSWKRYNAISSSCGICGL